MAHSRRNYAMIAQRFLSAVPVGLRAATVKDVRDAITAVTAGASGATVRQYTLRIIRSGVHAPLADLADARPLRRSNSFSELAPRAKAGKLRTSHLRPAWFPKWPSLAMTCLRSSGLTEFSPIKGRL